MTPEQSMPFRGGRFLSNPATLGRAEIGDCYFAGSSRLGRRISRMLSTRAQAQNSRYGAIHKSIVQTNLAATSPTPATMSHQPIQRSSARVERITQPGANAKLAIAIH